VLRPWIAGTLAVLAISACSSGGSGSDGGVAKSSNAEPATAPATGARPQSSVKDAVSKLLDAERRRDYQASFAYVVVGGPDGYADAESWAIRRQDLPAITGFTVEQDGAGRAIATVQHEPSLDPFRGLTPATERQVWSGQRANGGWLVAPEPEVTPVLPADAGAKDAVETWARAVQRCERAEAQRSQGTTTLFGSATQSAALCRSTGEVRASAPRLLGSGAASLELVAQYSTHALVWARVVAVVAPVRFDVVVAPIGSQWKVIGIADAA